MNTFEMNMDVGPNKHKSNYIMVNKMMILNKNKNEKIAPS